MNQRTFIIIGLCVIVGFFVCRILQHHGMRFNLVEGFGLDDLKGCVSNNMEVGGETMTDPACQKKAYDIGADMGYSDSNTLSEKDKRELCGRTRKHNNDVCEYKEPKSEPGHGTHAEEKDKWPSEKCQKQIKGVYKGNPFTGGESPCKLDPKNFPKAKEIQDNCKVTCKTMETTGPDHGDCQKRFDKSFATCFPNGKVPDLSKCDKKCSELYVPVWDDCKNNNSFFQKAKVNKAAMRKFYDTCTSDIGMDPFGGGG